MVGLPLPLRPERGAVELVAARRDGDRLRRRGGLAVRGDRLAHAPRAGDAEQRPVVLPLGGLEAQHAAVHALILEVHEPPFVPARRVDERALVGPIDARRALLEHDAGLVGAIDAPGPQRDLPAGLHAACGGEQVIPAIALVDLRPLDRRLGGRVGEDLLPLAEHLRRVGGHRAHVEPAAEARSRRGVRVREVGLAVVVPEGARIDEPASGEQLARLAPRARRARRRDDPHPLLVARAAVGGSAIDGEEDVERARVLADRRRPDALAVLRLGEARPGHVGERVAGERPVDQIARAQERQRGRAREAGGDEPVLVAHAQDVRVRVVRRQDGVAVRAVAEVRRVQRRRARVVCLGGAGRRLARAARGDGAGEQPRPTDAATERAHDHRLASHPAAALPLALIW